MKNQIKHFLVLGSNPLNELPESKFQGLLDELGDKVNEWAKENNIDLAKAKIRRVKAPGNNKALVMEIIF